MLFPYPAESKAHKIKEGFRGYYSVKKSAISRRVNKRAERARSVLFPGDTLCNDNEPGLRRCASSPCEKRHWWRNGDGVNNALFCFHLLHCLNTDDSSRKVVRSQISGPEIKTPRKVFPLLLRSSENFGPSRSKFIAFHLEFSSSLTFLYLTIP